jgi:predicted esterase
MHGGGFKFGSKRAKGIRLWSKSFALRGYTCAAINYRLSKQNPLRNFKALVEGCYNAVEDVEQALAYFRINHKLYRIDTTRIILAGNSAGAIIALHSVYSSSQDLKEFIRMPDSNLRQRYNLNNVAAVINFWGALFNPDWLKNGSTPIVSVHGKKDHIVPYKHKGSGLYGSWIIHQKADSLQIPNRLKSYDHFGHELQRHFIPILRSGATKRRWLEAGEFAAAFLYQQLWK